MGILKDFLYLLFPENCQGCSSVLVAGENTICTGCQIKLPKKNHFINTENELKIRFYGRVNFKYAIAMLHYSKYGIVQNLLRNLKYHNAPEIGHFLGNLAADEMLFSGVNFDFDTVIPVPLHIKRQKMRGYNQAEAFAKPIANKLKIVLDTNSVVRNVANQSQTKFSGKARWQNVKDIFVIKKSSNIENKNILVVDDVVTTGATIESLLEEILKHKPKSVSLLTIADAN